jgi:hypothetical protein
MTHTLMYEWEIASNALFVIADALYRSTKKYDSPRELTQA